MPRLHWPRASLLAMRVLFCLLLGSFPCYASAAELPERQSSFLRSLESELELRCQRQKDEASLWIQLALIRMQLGELEGASQALALARALKPADREILAHVAFVRFHQGNREESRQEIQRLTSELPRVPLVFYYQGVMERLLGETEAAQIALQRAHDLSPDDVRIALEWLRVRRLRASPEELESTFRDLLLRGPHDYEIQFEYAQLLLDLKRSLEAVAVAHSLTLEHPDWFPGQWLLARAYWAADDVLHTVFVLERLPSERLPAEACLVLGQAKERLGLYEDAVRYLELALRARPDFLAAERALASVYLRLEQESRVEEILGSVLARSPEDYDALYMMTRLWQAGGQLDRALAILRRLIEMEPSRPEAFRGLGQIALKRAEDGAAIGYLQQALERDKDDVLACEQLGLAFSRQGDHDKALFYFRRASELAPPRPESHYLLGRELVRLGRSAEGKKELRIAEELSQEMRDRRIGGMAMTPR